MKKIICLLFLLLILCACNQTPAEETPTPDPSAPVSADPAEETKPDPFLILVNKEQALPDNYAPDLVMIGDYWVVRSIQNDLQNLLNAAKNAGVNITINSAYRTRSEQELAFNNTVQNYVNQGNSQAAAEEKARQLAAQPGHSEHESGLAVDFTVLNGSYEEKETLWDWLYQNAHDYGFILRYPEGKEHITGYAHESWHYRYVGQTHAKAIYKTSLCLEEYLNTLN